ncbi:TRAP-type C4-dicarboxylate transport system, small permease component [Collimonas sp. OK242]|jgi:TRAP-type C4-dicarboxylate transport system permease small subunit|uniref:TRAP transporter small permease n=1 Tax=Collimonas sp. OK242 TaxID=1798195 RepID=UPI00089BC56A|nr:TRAP transporter small permease [Collimonas sp. OK242]SDY54237.1 TRAP-type C4-dicarboxylate transport system, small permease component [Collimonas sp. OK242]
MSHGFDAKPTAGPAIPDNPVVAALARVLERFNKLALYVSMAALMLTALIMTYSVVARYFFHVPTDWQDDATVFMLVGVIFLCAAYAQSYRGHIGIEALASILPAGVNAVRLLLVDVISCLFCGFFSWKSWALFHEAWSEGQTTSSTFAPPLWIPYSLMALGMTVLTLQILVQVLARLTDRSTAADPHTVSDS